MVGITLALNIRDLSQFEYYFVYFVILNYGYQFSPLLILISISHLC